MSQVAIALEIFKDRFMMLMRENRLLFHKEGVISYQYFTTHKDLLTQREVDNLNQAIKNLRIDNVHTYPRNNMLEFQMTNINVNVGGHVLHN